MDTKTLYARLACLIVFACGLLTVEAKSTTASANSKGFPPVKFNASSASHDDNDNDAPRGRTYPKPPIGFKQTGKASFYGGYWHGRLTADGEIYNQMSMTAAHKTLPFNSKVRVRNLLNNKEVVVRINNRGPYRKGRIIDLSVAAASKLDMRSVGIAPVQIEVIR